MKRLIQFSVLFAVLAGMAAGSASALTFQDRTCDNSKPTCPMPAGQAEVPYQFDMYARSGCPPYHYNITGGTQPPGLTLSTVNDSSSGGIGRMSGTPTTPGSYSFWVTITTPESPTCLGDRADRLFTLTIGAAPLAIKTSSLRRGIVGAAYTETLTASGGGNQWSATGLPPGLSISGSSITGTPTAAGDYNVTITVGNGTSTTSKQYVLTVIEPLKLTVTPARPVAEVGRLFALRLTATGGSGTHTWTATGLPEGLTFDAANAIVSGKPTTAGTYDVAITANDAAVGLTTPLNLHLKVADHVSILTLNLKAAKVGAPYLLRLKAADGIGPFSWRSLAALPAGLRLNMRTGALSGTPKSAGKFRIRLRVSDRLRAASTETFTLTVRA